MAETNTDPFIRSSAEIKSIVETHCQRCTTYDKERKFCRHNHCECNPQTEQSFLELLSLKAFYCPRGYFQ